MTESNSHAQRFRPLEDQKDQKKPNINVACNYAPLEDQQKTQIEFLQGSITSLVEGNEMNGTGALYLMSLNGDTDAARQLLESESIDVNLAENQETENPLMIASILGRTETVRLLLDYGADIDILHKGAETPLMMACESSREVTVDLLLIRGASVNARGDTGYTALMAAVCPFGEIRRFFIYQKVERKKNKTVPPSAFYDMKKFLADKDGGMTEAAISIASINIVKMLLDNGADINARNNQGHSGLFLVAGSSRSDTDMAKLLIDRGADVNLGDLDGRTPLCRACTVEMREYLLSRGARCDRIWLPTIEIRSRRNGKPMSEAQLLRICGEYTDIVANISSITPRSYKRPRRDEVSA